MTKEKKKVKWDIDGFEHYLKCNWCEEILCTSTREDEIIKYLKQMNNIKFKVFYDDNILCNRCWGKFGIQIKNVFHVIKITQPYETALKYNNGLLKPKGPSLYK